MGMKDIDSERATHSKPTPILTIGNSNYKPNLEQNTGIFF